MLFLLLLLSLALMHHEPATSKGKAKLELSRAKKNKHHDHKKHSKKKGKNTPHKKNISNQSVKYDLQLLTHIKDPEKSSLTMPFLKMVANATKANIFVETGTFIGNTSLQAAKVFKKVHTVELSRTVYEQAKANLSKQTNVSVYHGDSSEVFKTLLPQLKTQGKILFWLDGHYSGDFYGLRTAKGEKHALLNELDVIKKSGIRNAVILIDDIRMCDSSLWEFNNKSLLETTELTMTGYPEMNLICAAILNINPHYVFAVMGDILIAYLKEEAFTISPVVKACTDSYLFGITHKKMELVYQAAQTIAKAKGQERDAIEVLNNSFGSDLHAINYGVAKYYNFWYALILLSETKYEKALSLLNHVYSHGFHREDVMSYIARATRQLAKS